MVVSSWTCGCRMEFFQHFLGPRCPRSLACCSQAWKAERNEKATVKDKYLCILFPYEKEWVVGRSPGSPGAPRIFQDKEVHPQLHQVPLHGFSRHAAVHRVHQLGSLPVNNDIISQHTYTRWFLNMDLTSATFDKNKVSTKHLIWTFEWHQLDSYLPPCLWFESYHHSAMTDCNLQNI